MARIRSIHPGQWTDEDFVACSPMGRLLAIALRNVADDQGVFEWKPLGLKMQIFPGDNADVPALLGELSESNQIRVFDVSGKKYGAIRNFRRWQRPEKPKAVHPLPDDLRSYVGLSATDTPGSDDGSPNGGGQVADPSPNDAPSGDADRLTVADPSANDPRKSIQRKEEGGRREEEETGSSLRSDPPPPRAASGSGARLSKPEIDEHFEFWWRNYPRLVSKGAARRAYETALRKVGWDPEPLLTGLLLRLDSFDPREDGRFIPHASTWLNGERWTDGSAPPTPPSATPDLPLH